MFWTVLKKHGEDGTEESEHYRNSPFSREIESSEGAEK
jgi:hypothetical protein